MDVMKPRFCLAATALLLACDEPCVALPCAPPGPAVILTVTNAQGAKVPGVTAQTIGGPSMALECDSGSVCQAFGGPGDYAIRVSAPGFASRDVQTTVKGQAAGQCNCERVDTQSISVVLAPATGS